MATKQCTGCIRIPRDVDEFCPNCGLCRFCCSCYDDDYDDLEGPYDEDPDNE